MCGLIGAVSKKDVISILKDGLKILEYRGYDVYRGTTALPSHLDSFQTWGPGARFALVPMPTGVDDKLSQKFRPYGSSYEKSGATNRTAMSSNKSNYNYKGSRRPSYSKYTSF